MFTKMRAWKTVMMVFTLTGLILAVYSCNAQPEISDDLQEAFQKMIAIPDINQSISIWIIPDKENGYRFGKNVMFRVENLSDKKIFFPADSSFARIFIIQDNNWVEIRNTAKYFSLQSEHGSILYPKGDIQPNIFTTGVTPVIEESEVLEKDKQEMIRILIVGVQMENDKDTGVPVAAYVDLFVNP